MAHQPTEQLPFGWDDRNNKMKEKDLQLGGDAARKFATYSSAYDGKDKIDHLSSEQVREHYYRSLQESTVAPNEVDIPVGWNDRQKLRAVQAQQFTTSASKKQGIEVKRSVSPPSHQNNPTAIDHPLLDPHVALVHVATQSLVALAQTLEASSSSDHSIVVPMPQRQAFAQAVQQAMNAMAKTVSIEKDQ